MTDFDVAIVGAGPGGYVAALRAGESGARTLLVERDQVGGTCLNRGCIPSKALISGAELLHSIHHAEKLGIHVDSVRADWAAMQRRKDRVVQTLRRGIEGLLKARRVELFRGSAELDGPHRLVLRSEGEPRTVSARAVIVATGSEPRQLAEWPTSERIATSDEAVHWRELPRRLLVVGGGVIGCELGCLMQPLGVRVTIVEAAERLLPEMDADLSAVLEKELRQRGIDCRLATTVRDVRVADDVVAASLSDDATVEADRVLVAVGRRPRTTGLGLERAGIELDAKGFVRTDDLLATSAQDHYCIGDANGRCLLAHAASAQAKAAVESALGKPTRFDVAIPSAVYTFPEIGSVGLTEAEAKRRELPHSVGRFPLSASGRALAAGQTSGFAKVLRHRETDAILGIHLIGHAATEQLAAATLALDAGLSTRALAHAALAHPTLSEAIEEAAEDALGEGLHQAPRRVLVVAGELGA